MSSALPSSLPPPPKAAARALGRRPRMSHFLRVLVFVTGIAHVAFFLGVGEGLSRLGQSGGALAWLTPRVAWGVAGAAAISAFSFFGGRARAGLYDKRRPMWFVWL